MINTVLALEVLDKDGTIRDKIVKRGSNTSSSVDFGVRKDAPSSHRLTLGMKELNQKSVAHAPAYN